MGGETVGSLWTSASLERCGDPNLSDPESAVRFAFEVDDWLGRKSAGIDRPRLDGARLQHLVSATKDVAGRHFLSGLTGAVTSVDPLSLLQAAPAGQWRVPALKLRAKGRP